MAKIYQNTLVNETFITKVTTNGTVGNSAGVETCNTTVPGIAWNTCGFYDNVKPAITDGYRLYFKVRKRVNNNTAVVVGATNKNALDIDGAGTASIYFNGTTLTFFAWNSVFGSSVAAAIDTWYYCVLDFTDSDTIRAYYNTTGHSSDLADYTQLGSDSSIGYGTDNVRFQCNALGVGIADEFDVDEYFFTDTEALATSRIHADDFTSDAGLVFVSTGGTGVVTGGEAVLTKNGTDAWDTNTMRTSNKFVLGPGQKISFDFKMVSAHTTGVFGLTDTAPVAIANRVLEFNFFNGGSDTTLGFSTDGGESVDDDDTIILSGNQFYNCYFEVNDDGTVSCYMKLATDPSFTLLGTSQPGSSIAPFVGKQLYFYANQNGQGSVWTFDNFIWDDGREISPNEGPSADAGSTQTVATADGADLDGTDSTDDGNPDPPGEITYLWEKVSGPGTVTFDDDESATPHAGFSEQGVYVLRLTVDDSEETDTDNVTITVLDDPEVTINSGDQALNMPNAANLSAQVIGSGIDSFLWEKVSGPGTLSFSDADENTSTVTASIAGVYVIRATATNDVGSGSDECTITWGEDHVRSLQGDQTPSVAGTNYAYVNANRLVRNEEVSEE